MHVVNHANFAPQLFSNCALVATINPWDEPQEGGLPGAFVGDVGTMVHTMFYHAVQDLWVGEMMQLWSGRMEQNQAEQK